jgi:broad specificity phosphatase PhoE
VSRIILARHGRPVLDLRTPIPGHALAAWLDAERDAPLDPASQPGDALHRVVRDANRLIASPLRRSLDSARVLAPSVTPWIDEDVREAPLPFAFRFALKLRPVLWTGVARAAWLCGWSPGVEGVGAARRRAMRAARTLVKLAAEQGDIVVIGHGLMNALIAVELRALGWRGPRFPSRPHWGFGVYRS